MKTSGSKREAVCRVFRNPVCGCSKQGTVCCECHVPRIEWGAPSFGAPMLNNPFTTIYSKYDSPDRHSPWNLPLNLSAMSFCHGEPGSIKAMPNDRQRASAAAPRAQTLRTTKYHPATLQAIGYERRQKRTLWPAVSQRLIVGASSSKPDNNPDNIIFHTQKTYYFLVY